VEKDEDYGVELIPYLSFSNLYLPAAPSLKLQRSKAGRQQLQCRRKLLLRNNK